MDIDIEVWKDVKGFEGLYQVSNRGRVKSIARKIMRKNGHILSIKERILVQGLDIGGYPVVSLFKNSKGITYKVHRLVAVAFIPNPNNYPHINHIDKNRTNNNVENLEWCTQQYNNAYSLNKSVTQFDLEGNFIRNWPSARSIEESLHIPNCMISQCCNLKAPTAYGYLWRFTKPEYVKGYKLTDFIINKNIKSVTQFDLEGNFIKTWSKIIDASIFLHINASDISRCCKGKEYTAGGFIWKDTLPEYREGYQLPDQDIIINPQFVPVTQFDLEGNWIANYKSIKEASNITNIHRTDIWACCKGKLYTAGGYIWRYKKLEYMKGYKLDVSNINIFGKRIDGKIVSQFSLNGDWIRDWRSVAYAAQTIGGCGANISAACLGKRNYAYGFIWRYKRKEYVSGFNLFQIDMSLVLTQIVCQCDLKTEKIIREFPNALEAYKSNKKLRAGINGWQLIYHCCQGLVPLAYGYKWKFKK